MYVVDRVPDKKKVMRMKSMTSKEQRTEHMFVYFCLFWQTRKYIFDDSGERGT
jgi:hypothetical protein